MAPLGQFRENAEHIRPSEAECFPGLREHLQERHAHAFNAPRAASGAADERLHSCERGSGAGEGHKRRFRCDAAGCAASFAESWAGAGPRPAGVSPCGSERRWRDRSGWYAPRLRHPPERRRNASAPRNGHGSRHPEPGKHAARTRETIERPTGIPLQLGQMSGVKLPMVLAAAFAISSEPVPAPPRPANPARWAVYV